MKKISRIIILLSLLGLAATVCSAYSPRIAIVKSRPLKAYNTAIEEISRQLKKEDKGIMFSVFDLEGMRGNGSKLFAEIRRQAPDLILSLGTLATRVAKEKAKNIPIVFSFVLNPVTSGLIPNLKSSGSNLTGVALDIPIAEQFKMFKMVIPRLRTVAVFYNPEETGNIIKQARAIARNQGLILKAIPISSSDKLVPKLNELGSVDGLWMVADSVVFSPRNTEYILLYTLKEGLPFMGLSEQFVKAGALCSLTFDRQAIYKQTVQQIRKILNGANPEAIPITLPDKKVLVLNLKVADKIGLRIPSSTIRKAGVIFK